MTNAESIGAVSDSFRRALSNVTSSDEIEQLRVKFLGKNGELTQLMKGLSALGPDEKKSVGALLNRTKGDLEALIGTTRERIARGELLKRLDAEWIDPTIPVIGTTAAPDAGSLHPLTQVQQELERIFVGLGFTVVDGPEVESDYYNFQALNIPDTHPARDMQDTFWNKDGSLMRTQTSAIQVRTLERLKPPVRIVAPGRCFRYERLDSTHEHTFYQMEGMMVDRNVTVGHLIYFMRTLLRELFGSEQKIRLRPGYFPFVEPGFELDIWFQGRWMELLPCGLVHPRVLEYGGIDPNEWQAFAFGLGLSRLVMSRYMIDDIRHLQSGDLRFIKQF